jgi:PAS domain-containing protein
MPTLPAKFAETWRVLAYTLAIALAFIGLERLQMTIFALPATAQWLQRMGWLDVDPAARLQQEAAAVAAASQAALPRLPQGHRLAALRLGYGLGYVSQRVGVYAMSPPAVQEAARQRAAPVLAEARQQAQALGLGEVDALPVRSLREFTELGARFEADESGLAARVEQQLSPLHRHLFLLGVQVGGEMARVDDSEGRFALPPATPIRRHAVLAGLDAAVWQPLTEAPRDETPAQVRQRYRQAVDALAAAVARQDAEAPPTR